MNEPSPPASETHYVVAWTPRNPSHDGTAITAILRWHDPCGAGKHDRTAYRIGVFDSDTWVRWWSSRYAFERVLECVEVPGEGSAAASLGHCIDRTRRWRAALAVSVATATGDLDRDGQAETVQLWSNGELRVYQGDFEITDEYGHHAGLLRQEFSPQDLHVVDLVEIDIVNIDRRDDQREVMVRLGPETDFYEASPQYSFWVYRDRRLMPMLARAGVTVASPSAFPPRLRSVETGRCCSDAVTA